MVYILHKRTAKTRPPTAKKRQVFSALGQGVFGVTGKNQNANLGATTYIAHTRLAFADVCWRVVVTHPFQLYGGWFRTILVPLSVLYLSAGPRSIYTDLDDLQVLSLCIHNWGIYSSYRTCPLVLICRKSEDRASF